MSVISDLLGIGHFTTARGSTVRKDFLIAVAARLGATQQELSGMGKDEVLGRAIELATRAEMDPSLLSPGGTVTNEALQVLLDGLLLNGVPGRTMPWVDSPSSDGPAKEDVFDPEGVKDERDRRLTAVAVREGGDVFRNRLLVAYDGRCCMTGANATQALEAAHIYPYRGPATNKVTNGLLLRADLHRLFDRGAISVDEVTHRVLIKPHLLPTDYAFLETDGITLRLPKDPALHPSTAALRSHREWAGL